MLIEITLDRLEDHPGNREFRVTGERWEAFQGSIRERGVLQPLLVRPHPPEGYQVVAGHRRKRAALGAGLKAVPCLVKDLSDREALEMLVVENLEREDLDPVEEARGVRSLIEGCGMAPGEVAARLCRSLEWVRTRQLVLDLPEEAIAAMRLPKDDDRHLHVGTVQLMLELPGEEREMAVQMVLHPDFQIRTLSPRQAAEAIREVIVKPRKAKEQWEAMREGLAKTWRQRLRGNALRGTREDVQVQVPPWDECQAARPGRAAEESVPLAETTTEAPPGLLWQHLATRHGLAIRILPDEGADKSRAVVDELLLRQAEQALAEHGKEKPWLITRAKDRVTKEPPAAVQTALDALDGDPDPDCDLSEEVQTVIEQRMESRAVIDLGKVRRLREWAVARLAWEERPIKAPREDPPTFPPGAPDWALGVDPEKTIEVCDWVLGLKGGEG